MEKAIILLGSNTGNRKEYLNSAINHLALDTGKIVKISSIYESIPWGFNSKNNFLNQAIIIETEIESSTLIKKILKIEEKIGRKRENNDTYISRIIDIDIIFYGKHIINTDDLIVPHPLFVQRRFALLPVSEICADFIHPVLNKTVSQLLKECKDENEVFLYKKGRNYIKNKK